jgi:hypothetical protein
VADALEAAIHWMSSPYDAGAVNAVLLVEMSPGQITIGDAGLDRDLETQPSQSFVRVFTVGPSGTPSQRLSDFAQAGLGVAYQPISATSLLNDVISDF